MELDKRIIGKRPLDCVDSETAKEFIGKKGYFANCIQAFQDLESTDYQLVYATLKEVDSQRIIAFTDDFDGESAYFLPKEWVKEPEKKYRPYNISEFVSEFSLGDEIILRPKSDGIICHKLFVEYAEYDDGDDTVFLGSSCYGLTDLYEDCEIYTSEGWKPFGIKED